jgi:hypothetical protein
MLFHVYDEPKPEGYFLHEPFGLYRYILDADWFLYILLPILLLVAIGVLMLLWHLHEMPKHKADHKKMRQAELVSALTILGLFEHWVWAVALFIAYTDWGAVEDFLVRVLSRAQATPVSVVDEPSSVALPVTPPETIPVVQAQPEPVRIIAVQQETAA